MKASITYILTKKAAKLLPAILISLFLTATLQAQITSRLIGYGDYDYVTGTWHNIDSLKQNWLGNFGGDVDHPAESWNLTYRESINSNYVSINYASKDISTYNSNNQLETSTRLTWDGSIYQNDRRSTNTYDGLGRKVQILEEGWVGGTWVNLTLSLDSFDSNNNMVHHQLKEWNTATSAWDQLQIYSRQYNAAGKLTLFEIIYWNGTTWINQEKFDRSYDIDNYVLTETSYSGSGSIWTPSTRLSYQYDVNHNQTIYSRFTWNNGTSTWVNDRRDLYTYDANNFKTDWTNQTWSGSWNNIFRYLYTYNASNLVETRIRQNWSGTWDNYKKYTDVYNSNGFGTELKTQNWDGTVWVDAEKTTTIRNSSDQRTLEREATYAVGAWTTKSEKYYYYETYTPVTGVENVLETSSIKVFPNPFTQNCMVQFISETSGQSTIQVYDLSGRLVKETQQYFPAGENNWLFNGDDNSGNPIQKGMYLLRIENNGKASVQKISKL